MSSKPKILIFSSPLKSTKGGGELFINSLIKNIHKYDFHFIGKHEFLESLFKEAGQQTTRARLGYEPVNLKGVLLIPISLVLSLLGFIRFFKEIKRAKLLVFSLCFTEIFFLTPFIKLFFPSKKIIMPIRANKAPNLDKLAPLSYWLQKSLKKIWAATYITKTQYQEFLEKGYISSRNFVIYNGIEIIDLKKVLDSDVEIKNDLKKETKSNLKVIKIGYSSRLHKEKGLQDLFTAINILIENNIFAESFSLVLNIAGSGPDEFELKELAKKLNNKLKINWFGHLSDIKSFYNKQDFLVFPTYRESFGKVLIEGWERGLPVIYTDIAVFKEISKKLKTQFKIDFKAGDSYALAKVLQNLIISLDTFQSLESRFYLHSFVERNYNQKEMVKKYDRLFE